MTIDGHVQNGVVVFDQPITVPDGTPVRVELIAETKAEVDDRSTSTSAERWSGFIGKATGLPEDFADQHDHYIHGKPKR